jgi:integrase
MVRYYEKRRPIRRFFKLKKDAEAYRNDLENRLSSGASISDVTAALREVAGTGYSLLLVVRAGLETLQKRNSGSAKPNATFGDGYHILMARANMGGLRPKTLKVYESTLKHVLRVFGIRLACEISNEEVLAYLNSLCDHQRNRGKASAFTKKTILTYIKMVLRAAGMEKPLAGINLGEIKRQMIEHEIKFFKNHQIRDMFAAARTHERGFLALLAFAGIRPESLERMSAGCVSIDDQTIRIPAKASKTRKASLLETVPIGAEREFKPGPPSILWVWLRLYPFQPCKWSSLRERLRRAIGKIWIHDGLRHTAATNYSKKYGEGPAAELLTHTTPEMIREHYGGLTSRADADEFFAIGPESVAGPPELEANYRSKVKWPSDAALAILVFERPVKQIAGELNCSDTLVRRRCQKRGIKTPPPGYWTKVKHARQCEAEGQNGS